MTWPNPMFSHNQTHYVSGVDTKRAEQHFIGMRAAPLVPEAVGVINILQLLPHVPQCPTKPAGGDRECFIDHRTTKMT